MPYTVTARRATAARSPPAAGCSQKASDGNSPVDLSRSRRRRTPRRRTTRDRIVNPELARKEANERRRSVGRKGAATHPRHAS